MVSDFSSLAQDSNHRVISVSLSLYLIIHQVFSKIAFTSHPCFLFPSCFFHSRPSLFHPLIGCLVVWMPKMVRTSISMLKSSWVLYAKFSTEWPSVESAKGPGLRIQPIMSASHIWPPFFYFIPYVCWEHMKVSLTQCIGGVGQRTSEELTQLALLRCHSQ